MRQMRVDRAVYGTVRHSAAQWAVTVKGTTVPDSGYTPVGGTPIGTVRNPRDSRGGGR